MIVIIGWVLNDISLIRNSELDSKLSTILLQKANQGIPIYILVYDNKYSKNNLPVKHENIHYKVVKPPVTTDIMAMSTSLHSKIVIVDNTSWIGGIDLAYNRYDENYNLFDEKEEYPEKDYCNPLIGMVNNRDKPRMPWRDMMMEMEGNEVMEFVNKLRLKFDMKEIIYKKQEYRNVVILGSYNWPFGESYNNYYQSYLDIIKNSRDYIYIENQYFITSTISTQSSPDNLIGKALYERIMKAYYNKEKFQVIILLPPMVSGTNTIITRTLIKQHYYSIWSLMRNLYLKMGNELSDYICFFHLMKNERGISEMIYIHSKIILSDDNVIIVGSANINDRSLLERDVEIGCKIVGEQVETYRRQIMKLLYNKEKIDIKEMRKIGEMNREKLEEGLCYNNITRLKELNMMRKYKLRRDVNMDGNLVTFPYTFLVDEKFPIDEKFWNIINKIQNQDKPIFLLSDPEL